MDMKQELMPLKAALITSRTATAPIEDGFEAIDITARRRTNIRREASDPIKLERRPTVQSLES